MKVRQAGTAQCSTIMTALHTQHVTRWAPYMEDEGPATALTFTGIDIDSEDIWFYVSHRPCWTA